MVRIVCAVTGYQYPGYTYSDLDKSYIAISAKDGQLIRNQADFHKCMTVFVLPKLDQHHSTQILNTPFNTESDRKQRVQ